jgi:hypothetical protein
MKKARVTIKPVTKHQVYVEQDEGYLPSVSSFFFPSSFILLTVGLWLLSPVV